MSVALDTLARATLDHLFQLYIHDFTEFWAGTDRAELGEDGLWELDGSLDAYFTEPRSEALLVRANGNVAGFALINAHAHSGRDVDFNVGEFFVVRKYRRSGVGQAALALLLRERSGVWEAAVAEKNVRAQHFWRNAVVKCGACEIEEVQGDGDHWRGPIFRFRV